MNNERIYLVTGAAGFLGSLALILGILVGIVGMVLVALATPSTTGRCKKSGSGSLPRSCSFPKSF